MAKGLKLPAPKSSTMTGHNLYFLTTRQQQKHENIPTVSAMFAVVALGPVTC